MSVALEKIAANGVARFEDAALRIDRNFDKLNNKEDISAVSQNYTFTSRDAVLSLQVNATAAAITVYLPIQPVGSRRRTITKTDSSGNAVTVNGNGSLINGSATFVLTAQYDSITVEPTGTSWLVVDNPFGTASTAVKLLNTRTIGGSSFDGTANVTSFPVPGAIGGTTPSTGAFTTLSTTGDITATFATSGFMVLDRAATTNYGAIQYKTAGTANWISGLRETSDDNFHFYSYVAGGDVAVLSSTGLAVTGTLTLSGAFGCNGNAAQTKAVSGGTLAGVIAALVANGILSS